VDECRPLVRGNPANTTVGPDGIRYVFAQIPYAHFPKYSLVCSDYAQLCPIMPNYA